MSPVENVNENFHVTRLSSLTESLTVMDEQQTRERRSAFLAHSYSHRTHVIINVAKQMGFVDFSSVLFTGHTSFTVYQTGMQTNSSLDRQKVFSVQQFSS